MEWSLLESSWRMRVIHSVGVDVELIYEDINQEDKKSITMRTIGCGDEMWMHACGCRKLQEATMMSSRLFILYDIIPLK